jgi:hypothetical protein
VAFNLDVFETNFEDKLLLKGESLFDNKAVVDYTQLEKNLWTIYVKDDQLYETEILLSGKRIKNYSCDCKDFKDKKICAHVISSFFQLRKLKSPAIKIKSKPVVKKAKVLSVNQILKEINPDELSNFIRSYASKDPKFNIALKANFARKINLVSNKDKYKQVLDLIIKPATSSSYKISSVSINQYLYIALDYLEQFKDSVSINQYLEAYYILSALLIKNAYALYYIKNRSEKLLAFDKECHKNLDLLLNTDLAPELRQNILEMILELGQRSYYTIRNLDLNVFAIAHKHAIEQSSKDQVLVALKDKADSNFQEQEILHLVWSMLLLIEGEALIVEFIDLKELSLEWKIKTLNTLIDKGKVTLVEKIMDLMERADKDLVKRSWWNELNLEISLIKKDQKTIDKYSEKLLFKLFQFKYYALINDENSKTLVKMQLRDSNALKAKELLYQIYLFEEHYEGFKKTIIENADINSLIYYHDSISEKFEEKIDELYCEMCTFMLKNFIGNQVNSKVLQLLKHLRSKGLNKTEKLVLKLIKADFSQRTSLLKDLSLA